MQKNIWVAKFTYDSNNSLRTGFVDKIKEVSKDVFAVFGCFTGCSKGRVVLPYIHTGYSWCHVQHSLYDAIPPDMDEIRGYK